MKSKNKSNSARQFLVYVMLILTLAAMTGCASMRYGQVPCPCENTGRK